MKKILEKILNKIIIILIILNFISYQFAVPFSISRAQDTSGETSTEESKDSSDSDKEDEDDEEDKEEEEDEDEDEDEEKVEESEEVTEEEGENEEENKEKTEADENEEIENTQESITNEDVSETKEDVENSEEEIDEEEIIQETATTEEEISSETENMENESVDPSEVQAIENMEEANAEMGKNTIEGDDEESENNEEENVNESEIASEETNENTEEIIEENEIAVATGDTTAEAAVINEINTNIFTENGTQYVENITDESSQDVNLIEVFEGVLDEAQKLNEQNQEEIEKITVINENTAETLENNLIADANSGENSIENVDGLAEIVTGNAQALATAVNFVNTNIVGNSWVLAEINILGNWTGNLIVPGEGLFDLPSAGIIFDEITNVNLAQSIQNFLSANANTGGNSISSVSGGAVIETGLATADSNAVNFVNTDIVRNNWFLLVINNAGSWVGQVFNWSEEGQENLVYEYEFGSLEEEDPDSAKHLSVYNFNSAEEIKNYIFASANTGGNNIEKTEGAEISTGNASARASIFNFINTNIIGNNWFFGIVNNAGNWTGNLIFGYPDLEINLSANKEGLQPGENLIYTINYKNIGQAKCKDVDLILALPDDLIFQSESVGGLSHDGNQYYWSVEGLKPGEEKTFSVAVFLDPETAQDITTLESMAGLKTSTQEKNLANNYEVEKTDLVFVTNSQANEWELPEEKTEISVERFEEASAQAGSISNHSIIVENSGKETVYNLEIKDKIKDPLGGEMAEFVWPIAQLEEGQKATIEYQLYIDPATMLGNYEYTASAKGMDYYGREVKSGKVSKMVAFFNGVPEQIFVENNGEQIEEAPIIEVSENYLPEVLGATSEDENMWQWLLLLLFLPVIYYIRKEKFYRWDNIGRLSAQMRGFWSSFF